MYLGVYPTPLSRGCAMYIACDEFLHRRTPASDDLGDEDLSEISRQSDLRCVSRELVSLAGEAS